MTLNVAQYSYGTELKELRILGLQAMTGEAFLGGQPCLVAVKMAIDHINQRLDVLNGYSLTYDYINHEVGHNSRMQNMKVSAWLR